MRLTTTFTMTSFSSVRLSAIIKVRATRVLSAMRFLPSGEYRMPFRSLGYSCLFDHISWVVHFLHIPRFHPAIFLGCRKFCDYRLTFQFFPQGVVDMFGYCLVISAI